jgi:DNA-binding NarL/FixJ family response regulator
LCYKAGPRWFCGVFGGRQFIGVLAPSDGATMRERDRRSVPLARARSDPPFAVAPEGQRVLVADDHALTRFALRRALEDGGFVVCAEVGSAADAVEAALRERPDVCLLDLHMPGSIEAIETIASRFEETAVVVVTVARSDPDLFEAMCAGAVGYIPQDTDAERIPLALEAVLQGDIALPRAVVKKLVEEFRARRERRRLPMIENGRSLTEREWEVLEHLREGLSTAEIASRLFISQVTVRTHVCSIVKKLSVSDRSAAVRLLEQALRAGTR